MKKLIFAVIFAICVQLISLKSEAAAVYSEKFSVTRPIYYKQLYDTEQTKKTYTISRLHKTDKVVFDFWILKTIKEIYEFFNKYT